MGNGAEYSASPTNGIRTKVGYLENVLHGIVSWKHVLIIIKRLIIWHIKTDFSKNACPACKCHRNISRGKISSVEVDVYPQAHELRKIFGMCVKHEKE
jgi:hypothetical protein